MARIYVGFVKSNDDAVNTKFVKAVYKKNAEKVAKSVDSICKLVATDDNSKMSSLMRDVASNGETSAKAFNKMLKMVDTSVLTLLIESLFSPIDVTEAAKAMEVKMFANHIKAEVKSLTADEFGNLCKRFYGTPRVFAR